MGFRAKNEISDGLEEVACGGTSVVYRKRLKSGIDVLEKKLHPKFAGKENYLELYRREFQFLSDCDHPFIIKAQSLRRDWLGPDLEQAVLVEDFVDGLSLNELFSMMEGWDTEIKERIGSQISSQILSVAHYLNVQKKIIHADLVPENFLIGRDGWIRLIDFGLARRAGEEGAHLFQIVPRPGFSAPELFVGQPPSLESDLYSFAQILERLPGCDFQIVQELKESRRFPNSLPKVERVENLELWIEFCENKPVAAVKTPSFEKNGTSLFRIGLKLTALTLFGLVFSSFCPFGWLHLNSLPLSIVVLDGNKDFVTPVLGRAIAAGSYRVRFVVPDRSHQVFEKVIEIRHSEDLKVFEDFRNLDSL